MCRNENIKRPSPKNKYINPPYQIDSRLLHKPCFHTTHLHLFTFQTPILA